jgi:hypothetical protein
MKSVLLYFALLQSLCSLAAFSFPAAQDNSPVPVEDNKEPSPDRASSLLNSREAADRAWGAYLAGRYHLTNLQPRLQNLLPEILASNDQYLVCSFLEAEIQLGSVLSEEMMRTIYKGYPTEAVVIFSAAPENYRKLMLSLFQKETFSLEWFALGNLLLKIKEREFLMLMMMGIKQIPIDISVFDIFPNEGRGFTGGPGITPQKVPSSYPPCIYYALRAHSSSLITDSSTDLQTYFPVTRDSSVDLPFPGPTTVFAKRIVVHPGDAIFPEYVRSDFMRYIPPDIYKFRQQYVSAFLELPAEDVSLEQPLVLKWEGKAQYEAALTGHCRKILAKYDRIIALLLDRGLIQPSQAKTLEGSISLKIRDLRKDKTMPLPGIILNRVIIEKQK